METIKKWLCWLIERIAAQNNIRANVAQVLILVPTIVGIFSKVGKFEPTGLLIWSLIAALLALLGKKLLETKVLDFGAWLSIIYALLLYASDSPTVATLWPNATLWLAASIQSVALIGAVLSRQSPTNDAKTLVVTLLLLGMAAGVQAQGKAGRQPNATLTTPRTDQFGSYLAIPQRSPLQGYLAIPQGNAGRVVCTVYHANGVCPGYRADTSLLRFFADTTTVRFGLLSPRKPAEK